MEHSHGVLMEQPLTVLGAVLLVTCLCRPAHVHVRSLLQPHLHQAVKSQLVWISWAQSFSHPWLDRMVQACALTVTVEFYVSIIPMLVLANATSLAIELLFALTLCAHVSFGLKDIASAPRPHSVCAPQARGHIDSKDPTPEPEYGAPSAHVSLAVCTCYPAVRALQASGVLSPDAALVASAGASLWIAWLAWGRLYLGVHTPVDLISGGLVGAASMGLATVLHDQYLVLLQQGPSTTAVAQLAVAACAVALYPRPEHFTTSITYSVTFLGGLYGAGVSLALQHAPAATRPATLLLFLTRSLAWLPLVAVLLTCSKPLLCKLLEPWADLVPQELRALVHPPLTPDPYYARPSPCQPGVLVRANGVAWDVDTAARFLTFTAVGFAVFHAPMALAAAGL